MKIASQPVPAIILVRMPDGATGEVNGFVTAWTNVDMKVAIPWLESKSGWLEYWVESKDVRKPDSPTA